MHWLKEGWTPLAYVRLVSR